MLYVHLEKLLLQVENSYTDREGRVHNDFRAILSDCRTRLNQSLCARYVDETAYLTGVEAAQIRGRWQAELISRLLKLVQDKHDSLDELSYREQRALQEYAAICQLALLEPEVKAEYLVFDQDKQIISESIRKLYSNAEDGQAIFVTLANILSLNFKDKHDSLKHYLDQQKDSPNANSKQLFLILQTGYEQHFDRLTSESASPDDATNLFYLAILCENLLNQAVECAQYYQSKDLILKLEKELLTTIYAYIFSQIKSALLEAEEDTDTQPLEEILANMHAIYTSKKFFTIDKLALLHRYFYHLNYNCEDENIRELVQKGIYQIENMQSPSIRTALAETKEYHALRGLAYNIISQEMQTKPRNMQTFMAAEKIFNKMSLPFDKVSKGSASVTQRFAAKPLKQIAENLHAELQARPKSYFFGKQATPFWFRGMFKTVLDAFKNFSKSLPNIRDVLADVVYDSNQPVILSYFEGLLKSKYKANWIFNRKHNFQEVAEIKSDLHTIHFIENMAEIPADSPWRAKFQKALRGGPLNSKVRQEVTFERLIEEFTNIANKKDEDTGKYISLNGSYLKILRRTLSDFKSIMSPENRARLLVANLEVRFLHYKNNSWVQPDANKKLWSDFILRKLKEITAKIGTRDSGNNYFDGKQAIQAMVRFLMQEERLLQCHDHSSRKRLHHYVLVAVNEVKDLLEPEYIEYVKKMQKLSSLVRSEQQEVTEREYRERAIYHGV